MVMKQKRSNEPGKIPLVGDLEDGQIAMNTRDALLFIKKNVTGTPSIVRIGAEMSGPVAATLKEMTLPAFRAAVGALGDGQSWLNISPDRAVGVTYANTTTRPISISVVASGNGAVVSVRPAGGAWVEVSSADSGGRLATCITIPTGHEYRLTSATAISTWAELR